MVNVHSVQVVVAVVCNDDLVCKPMYIIFRLNKHRIFNIHVYNINILNLNLYS